jgi:hypothetical protein
MCENLIAGPRANIVNPLTNYLITRAEDFDSTLGKECARVIGPEEVTRLVRLHFGSDDDSEDEWEDDWEDESEDASDEVPDHDHKGPLLRNQKQFFGDSPSIQKTSYKSISKSVDESQIRVECSQLLYGIRAPVFKTFVNKLKRICTDLTKDCGTVDELRAKLLDGYDDVWVNLKGIKVRLG